MAGIAAYVVLLCLLLEGSARVFWWIRHGVPLTSPDRIHYVFYPELRRFTFPDSLPSVETFDILLLGGSVLNDGMGSVGRALQEVMEHQTSRSVRIHNLAWPAHTSLDSFNKYQFVHRLPFDALVVYHGLNELNSNNLPEDLFREDYSHYFFNRALRELYQHPEVRHLALPYTLSYLWMKVCERLGLDRYAPKSWPPEEWLHYGKHVKTAAPFRHNLERILALAARTNTPVVLMTYAYYLAPDYSLARFRQHQLDYTLHLTPTEVWGAPSNIVTGLETHNAILRDLAAHPPRDLPVRLVDQDRLMPRSGAYFNDLCHLTTSGSLVFAQHLALPLLAFLHESEAARR